MHSGELARLAGVTVRALRHYHRVGVLAEPERHANGYRDYDVHDLIRVLRIRRLASVGIPLERMPDLLDDTGDDPRGLLDELDAELADQIARLSRQRDLIARLRAHDAAPDLPPELAPFLAASAAGLPPELVRLDREQSVLLAHLAGEEGMPHLARYYERLADPELLPVLTTLSERFGRLGPGSTAQEISELVDGFVAVFAPVLDELSSPDLEVDLGEPGGLLAEYAADLLNVPQRRILEELEIRLEESRDTRGD